MLVAYQSMSLGTGGLRTNTMNRRELTLSHIPCYHRIDGASIVTSDATPVAPAVTERG
jgi:hypothetical protein